MAQTNRSEGDGNLYLGYDELGRPIYFSTSVSGFGNTRNTFYDAAGQVTSAQVLDSNPTAPAPLVRFTATYDPAGNKLSQLELDGSVTSYAYDASYQLVSEVRSGTGAYAITYAYDALGNRLSQNQDGQLTTYSYGAANQLLGQVNPDASLTTYAYDGNGNRVSESRGGQSTSYTWDGENRLLSVLEPSGTTSYTYGGDGLRRSTSDASGTKLFLWDGQNLLLKKDASLATQSLYLGVPDTYQSLLLMRQGSDWFFPAFDTQGSVRNLIAAGDVLSDAYTYSAYGLLLAMSGSTNNPMRYLGGLGYYSEDDNRAYVRARILEMLIGRFLSRDPISFGGGDWNLYRYVRNNPVNWVDPSGLACGNGPGLPTKLQLAKAFKACVAQGPGSNPFWFCMANQLGKSTFANHFEYIYCYYTDPSGNNGSCPEYPKHCPCDKSLNGVVPLSCQGCSEAKHALCIIQRGPENAAACDTEKTDRDIICTAEGGEAIQICPNVLKLPNPLNY